MLFYQRWGTREAETALDETDTKSRHDIKLDVDTTKRMIAVHSEVTGDRIPTEGCARGRIVGIDRPSRLGVVPAVSRLCLPARDLTMTDIPQLRCWTSTPLDQRSGTNTTAADLAIPTRAIGRTLMIGIASRKTTTAPREGQGAV
jgi:hypothetical protein